MGGPRGEVKKDFSHLSVELQKMNIKNNSKRSGWHIRIRMWFGGYKQACSVNTLKSLIENMITGVTEGYKYKMRLVYSHFPINAIIPKDGTSITVRNFLGGKQDKLIPMIGGTKVRLTPGNEVKDELVFEGNDNAALSLCCARVSQVCKTGRKDVRFLGWYLRLSKDQSESKGSLRSVIGPYPGTSRILRFFL